MKISPLLFAAFLMVHASFSVADDAAIAASAHATSAAVAGIEWRKDNDVDAAFALARAGNKPVFLYWGAIWCPPCNQVKATIFNRRDFIDKSRHFVPVYLDGDSPGAQKLAARFKVRGYPTMILLKPDGSEITRLPGEVDSERYIQVLSLAMNTRLSVHDTLKLALQGSGKLSIEDWRLLADYSWDDPEQKLVTSKEIAITLARLSTLSPDAASATRLYLKSLALSAAAKSGITLPVIDKTVAIAGVMRALADATVARDNMDILTGAPAEIILFLAPVKTASRTTLEAAWNSALIRLADDITLSKTDRLGALSGQIAIAIIDKHKPDIVLQKQVQKRVSQLEQATTDAYERQSVVNAAAHALTDAGLLDESDILLKAELKRSHSPYYFMSTLGANARQRGDKLAALNWYEQAYRAAKGPATRLQWGVNYVINIIELSPADEVRIQAALDSVVGDVGATENAFYERNRNALERMVKKLSEWNKDGRHQSAMRKTALQFNDICVKLPAGDPQRFTCQSVMPKL